MIAKQHKCHIQKIVSGGQTGVDRAALEAASINGIETGGWCPKGRLAEDGTIPLKYPMKETSSPVYAVRTRKNIADSDGTLILCGTALKGGTALTAKLAEKINKPLFIVDLSQPCDLEKLKVWMQTNHIAILNVAGPRESATRGIYEEARRFICDLLDHCQSQSD